MKNDFKLFPPIMEGIAGTEIMLSLDYGENPAPLGTINFFKKYGYLVIDNLFEFNDKDSQEKINLIKKVLNKNINLKLNEDGVNEYLFTSKNNYLPRIKSDLTAIYQHNTNLKEIPIYIKTLNREKHYVLLNPGRIIVFDKKLDLSYCNSLRIKIANKLKPVGYYFHQVFFSFNTIKF